MVCYYGSWAVYRPGAGKFDVEDIDPFVCTHIIFGFAGLGSDNTIVALDSWNELYDNYGKGIYGFCNSKIRALAPTVHASLTRLHFRSI